MPNRLEQESSPYLRQHADNPVDWYPWGSEALELAREEDRPILLSIGYSSCHWCHVMERESFEDTRVADLMNQSFVNIKVDREERPDLDQVYMKAVQAMTGGGGWPMTVFLTPEGVPFYGGTYFPPEPRHGMPSFPQVLAAASEAYRTRKDQVTESGARLVEALSRVGDRTAAEAEGTELLDAAYRTLANQYDG
ncbi:MAG: thioredoxin domain-containing protein, partial [Gemmatimonadota bacterium]